MHQRGDHVLEHHPVADTAAMAAQRVRRAERRPFPPISAQNSTQIGSSRHDGTAGTGHLDDHGT
jgi:hypothetical protein